MISEGHDVETASQMVDTMQSLRVGGEGCTWPSGLPLRQKANIAQALRPAIT